MKNQKTGKWIVGLGLSLLVAGAAQASVLYQDTFSTDGALAGRAVETGTGSWIGHSDLQTTGGVALPGASWPGKNALLAFTPEQGMVYTLSADVNVISGAWAAIGFISDTNSVIGGNEYFFNYVDSPAPWMNMNAAGAVNTFFGPTTTGSSPQAGIGTNGTLKIKLDTTGGNWKATYFFNGTALRTNTFAGSLDITHVGFGGYPLSNIEVDNFLLEVADLPKIVVFEDAFSANGSLTGRAVETGTGKWIGHSDLQTSGGVALPAATSPGKNALLAFTPQSGRLYTLSADANAISGAWVAIGFVSDTASVIGGSEFFQDYVDSPAPWMNMNAGGGVNTFFGPSTTGSSYQAGVGSSGTLKIKLDTSGTDWKATYFFNETVLRTHTFSGQLDITHVGFGGYPTSSLTVDNFLLTEEIPKARTFKILSITE